jgi:hypothetical protein
MVSFGAPGAGGAGFGVAFDGGVGVGVGAPADASAAGDGLGVFASSAMINILIARRNGRNRKVIEPRRK